MWADNETEIDLLGFEYLIDSLELYLTEPRLLPVTLGVTGDWGSGKSSLMKMARRRLDEDEANKGRYITVAFSPWRFEDYAHVKVALMTAVVDAIAAWVEADESRGKRVGATLNKVRARLAEFGLWRTAGTAGALVAGGGPEEAAAAGAVADAVGKLGPGPAAHQRSFATIAHFHVEFEELVEDLGDDIDAVVVFIDDMDRCTTETIIDTFEVISLFLSAPKTAYVIGAHEEIVQAALQGRYPDRSDGDSDIGHNYLEKMFQNAVAVPPLSEPGAQTYINLLFCELFAGDQLEALLSEARDRRERNQLAVAMNEGIAIGVMGELPEDLSESLRLADQLGPPLARGLRGNPRQLKRFLNTLQVRLRTAERRGMMLKPGVLAKLMVLERLQPEAFETLFNWQLEADGAPPQVSAAESIAAGKTSPKDDTEVRGFAMQPGIRSWLQLSPSLAETSLGPYFTFSRDKLKTAARAARLSGELQTLMVGLQSKTKPIRIKAVQEVTALDDAALTELAPALIEVAERDLNGEAAKSMVDVAKTSDALASAMFDSLKALPVTRIGVNFVLSLRLAFNGDARLDALFDKWEQTTRLKTAVQRARKAA